MCNMLGFFLMGDRSMNILWDFDGTICNSYPAYAKLFYETTKKGESGHEVLQHLKISFSHAFEYFQLTKQEINAFMEKNHELDMAQLPPFSYIEEVLKQADHNVVMTHKDRATVERVLENYDLAQYFTEIVTPEDGFPRKPDSASYQYLHQKYHLTLAIGDRELDLIPAKKIGVATCMFQGQCPSADFSIQSYAQFHNAWNRFIRL